MSTTAKGTPYPASTDTPDVPRDIEALADNIDERVPRKRQVGEQAITISASNTGTAAVTFPEAFDNVPMVILTKRYTAGAVTKCHVSILGSVSATGFTAIAATGDGSSVSGTVYCAWVATDET